jgi:prepilin-type N-terminal cleavage/methylation domain-containing protein
MNKQRHGFGLIEVIVAMIILTVGVLAMGASTGFILNQVRAAELRTDRMVVVSEAAEQLRVSGWTGLSAACNALESASDRFTVTCELSVTTNLARIRIISVGPSVVGGRVKAAVQDTALISMARPL